MPLHRSLLAVCLLVTLLPMAFADRGVPSGKRFRPVKHSRSGSLTSTPNSAFLNPVEDPRTPTWHDVSSGAGASPAQVNAWPTEDRMVPNSWPATLDVPVNRLEEALGADAAPTDLPPCARRPSALMRILARPTADVFGLDLLAPTFSDFDDAQAALRDQCAKAD